MEALKRQQKIEIRHSKQYAQKIAKELLSSKLVKCKEAYETEYGLLAQ
jgi:hypothetical protein